MNGRERLSELLAVVEQVGSVEVAEQAERLGVSPMTIRRDLLALERAGHVRRVHGGAIVEQGRSAEPPLSVRQVEAVAAKEAIGRSAAERVKDGDSIFLDSGTTCLEIARRLKGRRNVTVVTPSLRAAYELIDEQDMRVIIVGGAVRPSEGSLTGLMAVRAIEDLSVDRLFLAPSAIDASFGLSEFSTEDVLVKQAMIRAAREIVAVADSRKVDRVAFARICKLPTISTLITEMNPTGVLANALEAAGVSVVVAQPE